MLCVFLFSWEIWGDIMRKISVNRENRRIQCFVRGVQSRTCFVMCHFQNPGHKLFLSLSMHYIPTSMPCAHKKTKWTSCNNSNEFVASHKWLDLKNHYHMTSPCFPMHYWIPILHSKRLPGQWSIVPTFTILQSIRFTYFTKPVTRLYPVPLLVLNCLTSYDGNP